MRIFLSSPSDLAAERKIVLQVIERLGAEFRQHFPLKAIVWEHEPLLATEHFQEGLVSPADCDIVVCMFWSRLGSPLPADKFRRPDGSTGVTGTEWEFQIAVDAYHQGGRPQILVYRKLTPVQVTLDDEVAVRSAQLEKRQVDEFFERHFHHRDQAHSFKNAYWPFQTIDELEQQVYIHLSALLKEQIARGGMSEGPADRVVWHKGSPFRGLRSFDLEHADIYFGRNRARNELLHQFQTQVEAHAPFAMVLGTSGSGKSSLVKAGLLPILITPGVIPTVAECRWCVLRPSELGKDFISGLLRAIATPNGLPELHPDEAGFQGLLERVTAAPHTIEALIFSTLNNIKQSVGYRPELSVRLVLIIDQFEELFSAPGIGQEQRAAFVSLIASLARSEHTWVIGTLRSDFYVQCESLPELVELMRGNGQFHLASPSAEEIAQMITHPARAAGLGFELDADGIGLDEVLREAAVDHPGILPLLSFTLDQLFEQRRGNLLTYQAYRAMDGLEGAITRRADAIFSALTPAARAELPGLLSGLVSIRGGESENVGARRCAWSYVSEKSARQVLAEAFVQARLLVVSSHGESGESGESSVTVAHEALLRNWQRARDWIEDNLEYLRVRARISTTAHYWDLEGRTTGLLIPEGPLLEVSASILAQNRTDLSDTEAAFIEASLAEAERREQAARVERQQARRARQRRNLALAAGVVGLSGLALILWRGQEARDELEDIATKQARETSATKVNSFSNLSRKQIRSGDPLTGIHLALEAQKQAELADLTDDEARAALYQAVWSQPRSWPLGRLIDPSVSETSLLFLDPQPGVFHLHNGRQQKLSPTKPSRLLAAGAERAVLADHDGAELWDLRTPAALTRIDVHPGASTNPIRLSRSGRWLTAQSSDHQLTLYDAVTGQLETGMPLDGPVEIAALADDGSRALLREKDRDWQILELKTRSLVDLTRPVWAADRSAIDRFGLRTSLQDAEFLSADRLLLTLQDGSRSLWDTHRGLRLAQLSVSEPRRLQRRSTPEQVLAVALGHGITHWNWLTGWPAPPLLHRHTVADFLLTDDGTLSVDRKATVYRWDSKGELQRSRRFAQGLQSEALALCPISGHDRAWLIAPGRAWLLDTKSLSELRAIEFDATQENPATCIDGFLAVRQRADSIAIYAADTTARSSQIRLNYEAQPMAGDSSLGQLATLSFGRVIQTWDLRSGTKTFATISDSAVEALRFVAGGRYLAAQSNGRSRLWAIKGPGRSVRHRADFDLDFAAYDDRSQRLLVAGARRLRLIDANGEIVARRQLDQPITTMALATGGDRAAVVEQGKRLRLVDLPGLIDRDLLTGRQGIERVEFGRDGASLALIEGDKRIRLMAGDDLKELSSARHWDPILSYDRLSEGRFLSSTTRAVMHWSTQPTRVLDRREYPGAVQAAMPFGDGILALVRAPSNQTQVYDDEDGRLLGEVDTPSAEIVSHALSPDGTLLATADPQGHIALWRLASGKREWLIDDLIDETRRLYRDEQDAICEPQSKSSRFALGETCVVERAPVRLAFASDGQQLAIGRDGQMIRVVRVDSKETVLSAKVSERLTGFNFDNSRLLLESVYGELLTLQIGAEAQGEAVEERIPFQPYQAAIRLGGGNERFVPYIDGQVRSELAEVWLDVSELLAIAPQKGLALGTRSDGTIKLIDVRNGRQVTRLPAFGGNAKAWFSTDANHIVVLDGREVSLWPIYDQPIESVAKQILAGRS